MQKITVVMLAGTMRSTPLRIGVDTPALCLPMGKGDALLHLWQRALLDAGAADDVRVVVSTLEDVEAVAALPTCDAFTDDPDARQRIIAEPARWRGTGGILADVTEDLDDEAIVLAVEGRCVPPGPLDPMVQPLAGDDAGIVGVCGDDTPAGLIALTRAAIRRVPRVGYRDLKEQLLPELHAAGLRVRAAVIGDRLSRVRDRRTYLAALRARLGNGSRGWVSPEASVSGSATLDGCCLIEAGAIVEDGAVVYDSVILSGATVCGDAVVSRSVIAPYARIEPRQRIVRSVVSTHAGSISAAVALAG